MTHDLQLWMLRFDKFLLGEKDILSFLASTKKDIFSIKSGNKFRPILSLTVEDEYSTRLNSFKESQRIKRKRRIEKKFCVAHSFVRLS